MIVLAIGAHPDDLEINCAGTLAKMNQTGHQVVLCHASDGDKGHFEIPPDELALLRRNEAEQAGAVINCEVVSLGLKDCQIKAGDEDTRLRFIELVRKVQPDIVITHAPNDYMPDHVEVSKLVFDTTFTATVPGFGSNYPLAAKVPALYYMDNLSGLQFQPTLFVDITDTMELKLQMMRCHQSQLVWLKEHDGVDVLDFVHTLGKMRGIQAGCKFAEGFIHHMVWARPNAIRFPV
jgi:LmbE family N-acetylglucosaminyl deacetylase